MHELAKYLPPPSTKGRGTIRQIVPPAKNNSLSMRFALKLRTDSLHPYRMNWRIKLRTIVP